MSKKLQEEIGEKLKLAREKSDLTQEEVAKKAGLNTNYYACIERGEINTTIEKLDRVFKVLGIELILR